MKAWIREVRAVWPLLVFLGVLGGFTWVAHHPDAPVVDWALGRPWLAPAAHAFRDRWGSHPEGNPRELPLPADAESGPGSPPRVELVLPQSHPRVWAPAGALLYARPDAGAEVARRLAATQPLPYLARQGDWFQVRAADFEGWIELPGYDEVADPPLGSGRRAPVAGPGRPPDPELLAAAEELLGPSARRGELGGYALLTDVEDAALLARLARLAGGVEDAYETRFGLAPRAPTTATVVLFRREPDYRRFQARTPQVAGLASSGHTGGGLVALFAERDASHEVEDSFVHELTHDVTRRALGPALPPWLAEGLADELAQSRWDERGRWLPSTWSGEERLVERRSERIETEEGRRVRVEESYTVTGGRAALQSAQEAAAEGRLLPLAELVELPWRTFVGGAVDLHYTESFLLVRYLLSDPRHAPRFRAFLAAVAAGGPADGSALRRSLGVSWDELDAAFQAWLTAQN